MARKYGLLRGAMFEFGDTQADLGSVLSISSRSVSDRMTGKISWSLDEMYTVMDRYGLPYSQLHEFFPNYRKLEREVDARERASQETEGEVCDDEIFCEQADGQGLRGNAEEYGGRIRMAS